LLTALAWAAVGLGLVMGAGTLLSLSRSTHWVVRLWDFPRVQMAAAAAASGLVYALVSFRGRPLDWAFLAVVALTIAWQLRRIFPYLPLAPVQVERSRDPSSGSRLRLMISNVLMENTRHDLLIEVVRETDPELLLVMETDADWERALEPLAAAYPHVIRQPQDNYYGLMLFSRLPLLEQRIDFLVQDDIPSVHVRVRLPGGEEVMLHGLHPRPPEPLRDQESTPRDAELVMVGRAIGEAGDRPTVVAGDLNDVAWSRTTELFLKLSRLLDPRLGRGFYNSYNAKQPLFRYPLDHVFHSRHFRLVHLERLRSVGSDHFPMLVELSLEEGAAATQQGEVADADDEREASERLEEQAEAAATGDDRPGRE
jgi:endonuclease/exonuclease/phosphatase (EEP) superfamily protein YafD